MPVLNADQLAEKLREIKARLQAALAPRQIYFFGSYAYGTPQTHSDIDLVVVIDDTSETPFERDARAYRALRGIGVPKDVMVYTVSEFEQRASLATSFERTVKSRGRLLYDADRE